MPTAFRSSLVALLSLLLLSCNSEDDCLDSSISLTDYIAQNELTVDETDSGLRYIIQETGDTLLPTLSDTVSVEFVGYTTDRDTFDQTTGSPRALLMEDLILGWQSGLQFIGEGGRIQLFVPANLGYAGNPVATICGNTDLIFEVELVEIR
jgi:FKBP-type peptidyl-prolyl cis-trans isomerase